MDSVIHLAGVGKRYIKVEDTPTLVTTAFRLGTRTTRSVLWALREIDLDVTRGASLGVIGRNGSGKSTLLQLIAGVTAPSEGAVRVTGRVAPLVSVGVGFHPELTGRENVHVNGTILGLSRREITSRLDEIIAFAEIEEFIDTPVKFYSSGMFVRLGFSVAMASEPDILLVDEVLAVGDLGFQVRSFDAMLEARQRGTTLVVVSHNLNAIRRLCDRTLLLERGHVVLDGPPADAIGRYHDLLSGVGEPVDGAVGRSHARGAAIVESLELLDAGGRPAGHFQSGDDVVLRIAVRVDGEVDHPLFALNLFSDDGTVVYGESTPPGMLRSYVAGERLRCEARLRLALASGTYGIEAGLLGRDVNTRVAWSRRHRFFVTGRVISWGIADLAADLRVV